MEKPTVLRGLVFNFDDDFVVRSMQREKLLLLDIDFSANCDLNCSYCDRINDRKSPGEPLSFKEKIRLFDEARDLGCRTVEIPGVGEPMLDPHFWEYLEAVHARGMITVLYTSAYSRNGILIDDAAAKRLKELDVSVIMKYESMDKEVQDRLVRKNGYSAISEQAIIALMKAGFNTPGTTRLGIHTVITDQNVEGVCDIFRFCRNNRIFPYIVSSIPFGNALQHDCTMGRSQSIDILNKIKEIDRREYGIGYDSKLPVAGGFVCRQINVGVFVNLYGDLFQCNAGGVNFGNIREFAGLKAAWNSEAMRDSRKRPQNGYCPVRESFWQNGQAQAE